MATVVELPRLSDTMQEGVIAKWHVAEGDKVKRGQIIADIETDKATMEFESFDSGTVLKLVASEGDTLPLGAPIAVLGKPGEDAEAALGGDAADETPAKRDTDGPQKPSTSAKASKAKAGKKTATGAKAKDEPGDADVGADVEDAAAGEAKASSAARADRTPAPHPNSHADGGRIAASPLARRLAREHGLQLAAIGGTGPHGRIVKADVDAAAASAKVRGTGAAADQRASRPDTEVKLSQMRKTIAKRMAQANAEIPHFYLTAVVRMDNAVVLRGQLKQALPDARISFNDLVVLACARALAKHPDINAYWNGTTIVRRGDINVGIAVALDDGLIVPVIGSADRKSLRQVAAEASELGARARDKKLTPEQMTGSTFTVSNLGMFGIESFSAVVNPGEGAILAVGSIVDEAVVEAGQIVAQKRMRMTLSCDHRVMDGAMGAKFLGTVRELLEQPLGMLA